MTRDILEVCKQVHDRIHKGFRYVSDEKNYGVLEDWRFPTDVDRVVDDCDGFAIACRQLIREEGLESRLVMCYTETNEGHLVCAVGNYILDNRYYRIMTKEELVRQGYRFMYISGLNPGDAWKELR